MKTKKTFVMYPSWRSYFELLDDAEQCREHLYVIFDTAEGKEPTITNSKVKTAYGAIKDIMQDHIAAYEAKCEKNRRSAEKRWNNANGMHMHTNAMRSHGDNDNAYDNDSDNDNKNEDDNDDEYDTDLSRQEDTTVIDVFQVMQAAKDQGIELPMNEASAFIDYYFIQNHGLINGEPIRNWKNLLKGWNDHILVNPTDVYGDGCYVYNNIYCVLPKAIQTAIDSDQERFEGMLTRKTVQLIDEHMSRR